MKITMQHAMSLSWCYDGIISFCKKKNIDYKKLIYGGIEEEELSHFKNDVMVQKVIERAKKWAVDQNHNS